MNITTKVTCVGFLLAISTLTISGANATSFLPQSESISPNIESRLSRLTEAMKQRGIEPLRTSEANEDLMAIGWGNGNGGGWGNLRGGGGFANRNGGGSFINRNNPWRNGGFNNRNWGDGGSFINRNGWPNGGGFVNRW
ncbi:GrrA/OscA1 family cyclophane-containing rSAM-modified RiPP [Aphanothece sacrum]|uniref:RNA helicase n=1 Tax=Aphanothece sacrum FPU1 TaxID=1920663 RepID=A0A401IEY2_APHSA|nr:GrrA/OscA1 family cyclophane-containing rSAM-modified RiPP [Aphanothece sacrum]GBF79801.1 RNA helicase [Aphanothece sacrum FPU1]GBF84813.1 RNA helicase [Aphanothece sacrum FPU3]